MPPFKPYFQVQPTQQVGETYSRAGLVGGDAVLPADDIGKALGALVPSLTKYLRIQEDPERERQQAEAARIVAEQDSETLAKSLKKAYADGGLPEGYSVFKLRHVSNLLGKKAFNEYKQGLDAALSRFADTDYTESASAVAERVKGETLKLYGNEISPAFSNSFGEQLIEMNARFTQEAYSTRRKAEYADQVNKTQDALTALLAGIKAGDDTTPYLTTWSKGEASIVEKERELADLDAQWAAMSYAWNEDPPLTPYEEAKAETARLLSPLSGEAQPTPRTHALSSREVAAGRKELLNKRVALGKEKDALKAEKTRLIKEHGDASILRKAKKLTKLYEEIRASAHKAGLIKKGTSLGRGAWNAIVIKSLEDQVDTLIRGGEFDEAEELLGVFSLMTTEGGTAYDKSQEDIDNNPYGVDRANKKAYGYTFRSEIEKLESKIFAAAEQEAKRGGGSMAKREASQHRDSQKILWQISERLNLLDLRMPSKELNKAIKELLDIGVEELNGDGNPDTNLETPYDMVLKNRTAFIAEKNFRARGDQLLQQKLGAGAVGAAKSSFQVFEAANPTIFLKMGGTGNQAEMLLAYKRAKTLAKEHYGQGVKADEKTGKGENKDYLDATLAGIDKAYTAGQAAFSKIQLGLSPIIGSVTNKFTSRALNELAMRQIGVHPESVKRLMEMGEGEPPTLEDKEQKEALLGHFSILINEKIRDDLTTYMKGTPAGLYLEKAEAWLNNLPAATYTAITAEEASDLWQRTRVFPPQPSGEIPTWAVNINGWENYDQHGPDWWSFTLSPNDAGVFMDSVSKEGWVKGYEGADGDEKNYMDLLQLLQVALKWNFRGTSSNPEYEVFNEGWGNPDFKIVDGQIVPAVKGKGTEPIEAFGRGMEQGMAYLSIVDDRLVPIVRKGKTGLWRNVNGEWLRAGMNGMARVTLNPRNFIMLRRDLLPAKGLHSSRHINEWGRFHRDDLGGTGQKSWDKASAYAKEYESLRNGTHPLAIAHGAGSGEVQKRQTELNRLIVKTPQGEVWDKIVGGASPVSFAQFLVYQLDLAIAGAEIGRPVGGFSGLSKIGGQK